MRWHESNIHFCHCLGWDLAIPELFFLFPRKVELPFLSSLYIDYKEKKKQINCPGRYYTRSNPIPQPAVQHAQPKPDSAHSSS